MWNTGNLANIIFNALNASFYSPNQQPFPHLSLDSAFDTHFTLNSAWSMIIKPTEKKLVLYEKKIQLRTCTTVRIKTLPQFHNSIPAPQVVTGVRRPLAARRVFGNIHF